MLVSTLASAIVVVSTLLVLMVVVCRVAALFVVVALPLSCSSTLAVVMALALCLPSLVSSGGGGTSAEFSLELQILSSQQSIDLLPTRVTGYLVTLDDSTGDLRTCNIR